MKMKNWYILNQANDEMNWIMKNIKSSESLEHLDSCMNCFFLWKQKFQSDRYENPSISVRSYLKDKFWTCYKNQKKKISIFR